MHDTITSDFTRPDDPIRGDVTFAQPQYGCNDLYSEMDILSFYMMTENLSDLLLST